MSDVRVHPSNPVTLKDTGYREERLWSPVLNMNMKPEGGSKKSKGSTRKIGRMKRKGGWAFDGGDKRMAARKARRHRCDRPALHMPPCDPRHSGQEAA